MDSECELMANKELLKFFEVYINLYQWSAGAGATGVDWKNLCSGRCSQRADRPHGGFDKSQVKAAFHIPDTVDICCLLCLGYATEPLKKFGGRFDFHQVCYAEEYGKPFFL